MQKTLNERGMQMAVIAARLYAAKLALSGTASMYDACYEARSLIDYIAMNNFDCVKNASI